MCLLGASSLTGSHLIPHLILSYHILSYPPRLVNHLGVHSRLWLLFFCTLLAAPLAVGTLHFPPPGAFGEICHVTTLLRPEFLFIIFIAYFM